jgi:hypothetical protein
MCRLIWIYTGRTSADRFNTVSLVSRVWPNCLTLATVSKCSRIFSHWQQFQSVHEFSHHGNSFKVFMNFLTLATVSVFMNFLTMETVSKCSWIFSPWKQFQSVHEFSHIGNSFSVHEFSHHGNSFKVFMTFLTLATVSKCSWLFLP